MGQIEQTPPEFSAIKVNGKRSYKLARSGEKVILKSRLIRIKEIRLIFNNDKKVGFFIRCSKGTYIRSFARDLAEKLGSFGYISNLRRLKVGNFRCHETISLDKLKILSRFKNANFKLKTVDVLGSRSNLEIEDDVVSKLSYGQKVALPINSYQNQLVNLVRSGKLIAVLDIKDSEVSKIIRFVN